MSKNAVTTVAKETPPPMIYDNEDVGAGFEDVSSNELSIPFISILQKTSPQVEEGKLAGAESGALYNTVTQEIIPGAQGFVFQPCHRDEAWVEWVPRIRGGGFVSSNAPDSDLVKDIIQKNGGKRIPPKGSDGKRIPFLSPEKNEVVETYYVYGLILDDEGKNVQGFAVLSFTSTKVTKYKNWITSMKMQKGNPPIFANRARITTTKETRPSGTSFNYQISPFRDSWASSLINPQTERDLLDQAKGFREMILSGQAKADMSKQAGDHEEGEEGTPF